jgi:hypothetical protein
LRNLRMTNAREKMHIAPIKNEARLSRVRDEIGKFMRCALF